MNHGFTVDSDSLPETGAESLLLGLRAAGVDFISDREVIHFSSVLALHRNSNTLHVDDTLMVVAPADASARRR